METESVCVGALVCVVVLLLRIRPKYFQIISAE